MLTALVLVVSVAAATPKPMPTSELTQLKVISSVKATASCSAMRTFIGPAISAILRNDETIDFARPIFSKMYDDYVVWHSGRMKLDTIAMENLITPMVQNTESANKYLNASSDVAALAEARGSLSVVLEQQNKALNVISGFVGTYQLGEIAIGGLPIEWQVAFNVQRSNSLGTPSAIRSRLRGSPLLPAPMVGQDPFAPYSRELAAIQETSRELESKAARIMAGVANRCS